MLAPTLAETLPTITFESPTYTLGEIDGQDGWKKTNHSFDAFVVDTSATTYQATLGDQALRISNRFVSSTFGDHTFSKPLANEAGETAAANDGMSGGTRQRFFSAEWDVASVTGALQDGLSVVASPDRGDGARMSWIQMADDTTNGFQINFYDFRSSAIGSNSFVLRPVVTGLDRGVPHKIKVTMEFLDGPDNDIVKVYVDGTLRMVGTSWEGYFPAGENKPTRTVDSVLFRMGTTDNTSLREDHPEFANKGFYLDNLVLTSSDAPARPAVYVRPDGDDINCDGSADASAASHPDGACAFKTIQRGVNVVDAGGTVNVGDGDYTAASGATLVTLPHNKAVTINGEGIGVTNLLGTSNTGFGFGYATSPAAYSLNGITIQNLSVSGFHVGMTLGDTGDSLTNFMLNNVSVSNNANHGIWSQAGTVTSFTANNVTASENGWGSQTNGPGRGLYIINGAKSNLTIQDGDFVHNFLVGIDISDGTASGVTITGNTVTNNGDAGIGVLGPTGSMTVANNTVTNNGRFGIEIKNPDGPTSGTTNLVVNGNTVSRTTDATDARDHAGILVMRRDPNPSVNVDQPAGVLIQNNVVTGYRRKPSGSTGDGFGIVVAGSNMQVRNNVVSDNDVGIQAQAGNPSINGQNTEYFDRDNAASFSGIVELNSITATNVGDVGLRGVGLPTAADVTRNWYGSPTGPTNAANLGGTGASVVGANLTFSPWLGDGTDTAPGTVGFQTSGTPLYGIPTMLAFATQPGGAAEGAPFGTQPVVRAQDASGNLGFNFNGPVTVALGVNPEAATLLGTATVTATNGVATFTGLGLNDSGTGYTLTAADSGLTGATSNPFDSANANPAVTMTAPAPASQVLIGRQISASATFTDAGTNDTHTCAIDWGDGSPPTAGTLVEPAGATPGSCTGTHNYGTTGSAPVQITVTDDDTGAGNGSAGITRNRGAINVSQTTLNTSETGTTAQFTVGLSAAPTSDVTVTLNTSDPSEGTVNPPALTFTPASFGPQPVTVTGVDDNQADGPVQFTIGTGAATSADIAFSGVDPADVAVTNADNETASIVVAPASGLTTTENGGTAAFTIVLASQPTANVVIGLSSSNTNEGTVSPSSVTFTPANWSVPQTVTVTGVNDNAPDGNTPYTIVTAPATSTDPAFNGVDLPDVSVTNLVGSFPSLSVADASAPEGESGTTPLTFTVTLSQASPQVVTVQYAAVNGTAKSGEDFTPTNGTLTFNPGETSKTIAVPVIGEAALEETETFFVDLSQASGATIARGRATGTITNDEFPASCVLRPDVDIRTQVLPGRAMQVTIRANVGGFNDANQLTQIRFGAPRNATIEMPGQTTIGTSPITLGSREVTFIVRQTDPSQPVHVPFTIEDTCGAVEKFVGGGKDAFAQ